MYLKVFIQLWASHLHSWWSNSEIKSKDSRIHSHSLFILFPLHFCSFFRVNGKEAPMIGCSILFLNKKAHRPTTDSKRTLLILIFSECLLSCENAGVSSASSIFWISFHSPGSGRSFLLYEYKRKKDNVCHISQWVNSMWLCHSHGVGYSVLTPKEKAFIVYIYLCLRRQTPLLLNSRSTIM